MGIYQCPIEHRRKERGKRGGRSKSLHFMHGKRKDGYDLFEASHLPPTVTVTGKRYSFMGKTSPE